MDWSWTVACPLSSRDGRKALSGRSIHLGAVWSLFVNEQQYTNNGLLIVSAYIDNSSVDYLH